MLIAPFQTRDLSRQSSTLLQRPQGRHVRCGLVLESVLESRGQTFTPPVTQVVQKKPVLRGSGGDANAEGSSSSSNGNGNGSGAAGEQHLERLASPGSAVMNAQQGPGISVTGNPSMTSNAAASGVNGSIVNNSTFSSPSRMEVVD